MKVVVPTNDNRPTSSKIILPLVEEGELYELNKYNSVEYTLNTNPGGAGQNYKLRARILEGGEEARYVLRWFKDFDTVKNGLGLTAHAQVIPIVRTVLRGNALSTFNTAVSNTPTAWRLTTAEAARQTSIAAGDAAAAQQAAYDAIVQQDLNLHVQGDDVYVCVGRMMAALLPHNCLARVKRNIRREVRKPSNMTIRTYYHHLARINNEEIPLIPPFAPEQKFGDDEFTDILLFGTPKSWQVHAGQTKQAHIFT